MKYNQFKTIKNLQDYYRDKMVENLNMSVKLPFYNMYPYKPTKMELKNLKESVKDVEIVLNRIR